MTIPEDRRVLLEPGEDGRLIVRYPTWVVRFLLSDGSTVDVECHRDDSDLRGALLEYLKVEKIEGSVRVSMSSVVPAQGPKPTKRAARKRTPTMNE